MPKVTYRQVREFQGEAQGYLAANGNQDLMDLRQRSKFGYALKRMLKATKKHAENLREQIEELQIDHAVTEKVGEEEVLAIDAAGNFRMTKQGLKDRSKKERVLLSSEVEIDPYIAKSIPSGLPWLTCERFKGFVILDEEEAEPTEDSPQDETVHKSNGQDNEAAVP